MTGKLLSVAADTAVVRVGSGWFAAGETLSVALGNQMGAATSCGDSFTPCDAEYLYPLVGMAVGALVGRTLFPEHWDRVTPERLRVGLARFPYGRLGLGGAIRFWKKSGAASPGDHLLWKPGGPVPLLPVSVAPAAAGARLAPNARRSRCGARRATLDAPLTGFCERVAASEEASMSSSRTLVLLALLAVLTGCYSYRSVPLASVRPKHDVRVTTRLGARVELVDATVAGDSLRGRIARLRWPRSRRERFAIAAADLTRVEVKRLNVGRSVAVGVAAVAAVAVPVVVVLAVSSSFSFGGSLGSGDWGGFP